MCPIGNNQAFCRGWDNNNGDYGAGECSDNYPSIGPFSSNLVGCPLDTLNQSEMAKPPILVGIWQYVNESKGSEMGNMSVNNHWSVLGRHVMAGEAISGKIVYSKYGNFTLTIPNHNSFGDYSLEGSFGSSKNNILTECYAGGCENNTLIAVSPNHVEFQDNNGNIIHLMRTNSSTG